MRALLAFAVCVGLTSAGSPTFSTTAAEVPATTVEPASTAPPAGAPDSKGREFWLAFPMNYSANSPLQLFVTGDRDTTGRVEVEGLGFTTSFNVRAGQVTTVALPAGAQLTQTDGVETRGIHVTAADEVTVYGLNRVQYTTDAYLALPVDILGTDHVVLAYQNANVVNGSQLAVAAAHDDTVVTITPSTAVGSRPAGVPFDVVLDAGQAYQLRSTASAPSDVTGTLVVSDKPVAVYGSHQCANIPPGFVACDHIVEQLFPTTTWGQEFATMPLATRTRGDTFRFLAAQDDTEVRIGGVVVARLARGKHHEQIVTGPAHITSDKPILVAQFSNGSSFDGQVSDPFMMLVPPVEQFLGDYTVSTPASGFARNFVNVIVKTADAGAIRLDGTVVPASSFRPIGASDHSGAQLPVSLGSHRLESDVPFGLSVYGFDSYDSYGYPGGLSLAPVARVTSLELEPAVGATALIRTEHCVTAAVRDQDGLPLSGVRVDFATSGANTLSGFVPTADGVARWCYAGQHEGDDVITAAVGKLNDTASMSWTDNRPPVASTGGPYTVDEGSEVVLDGSASSDPDGDPLTLRWDLDGDGSHETSGVRPTFDAADRDGPSALQVAVQACDPLESCHTESVDVVVRNVAPTVSAGPELTAFRGDDLTLRGTWSDPATTKDAPYAWAWETSASSTDGTADHGGTAERTHAFASTGTHSAELAVIDDDGGRGTARNSILVLNRPPSCADLALGVHRIWPPDHEMVDVPVRGAVDPDGDPVSVEVVQIVQDEPLDALGDGTTQPDGAGVGTPVAKVRAERSGTRSTPGDGRVYTVSVRVTDGSGARCVRELTVVVPHDQKSPVVDSGVRYDSTTGKRVEPTDAPSQGTPASMTVQVDDAAASTAEDEPVDVVLTARNLPVDRGQFRVLGAGPSHGAITGISAAVCEPLGDGTRCTATARYTPDQDSSGDDGFAFVVTDGTTGWQGQATVVVTSVNDAPRVRAVPERLDLVEDGPNAPVEIRSVDAETAAGDLDIRLVEAPAAGHLLLEGERLVAGDVLPGGTAALHYQPGIDHAGATSFRIRVADDDPVALSEEIVVPVMVNAVDDAPTALPVRATTAEDEPVTVEVSAVDVDSRALQFSATAPSSGTLGALSAAACTPVDEGVRCTATVLYTPAQDATGSVPLAVSVTDGVSTSALDVALEVTPVNDAPVVTASPASLRVAEDSGRHLVRITAADVETPPADLTLRIDTLPTGGVLRQSEKLLAVGDVIGSSSAAVTYEPGSNNHGADSFTLSGSDSEPGGTTSLTIDVQVTAVDDAPVFEPVHAKTAEDENVVIGLSASDVDSPALTFTRATAATRGTAGEPRAPTCVPQGAGTLCTSRVGYAPTADLNGQDVFDIAVSDGSSTTRRAVTVAVAPVNDAPVAVADQARADQGDPLVLGMADLLANDSAGPQDEADQELSMTEVTPGPSTHGTVSLNDGSVTYTSNAGFTGQATFGYTVCDHGSPGLCSEGTVSVDVQRRNSTPTITAIDVTTAEDAAVEVTVEAHDADGQDLQLAVGAPQHGTLGELSLTSCTTAESGSVCSATVRFTSSTDYAGEAGFTVTATDGRDSVQAPARVEVTSVNDEPVLTLLPGSLALAEDGEAELSLSARDVETAVQSLVVKVASVPEHGRLMLGEQELRAGDALDGAARTLRYLPAADRSGSDRVVLSLTDTGQGSSPSITVERVVDITVSEVNDAPVPGSYTGSAAQGEVWSFPAADLVARASAGPADEQGQRLTVSSVTATTQTHGTVELVDGQVRYRSEDAFEGEARFTYRLCDDGTTAGGAHPKCTAGAVVVSVVKAGPPPTVGEVAPADGLRVTEPTPVAASITPPAGSEIASWQVTATLVGGGAPVTVASGEGAPPTTLGTFDPTVLANGVYELVVAATTTQNGTTSTSVTVVVDGQLKLGRFAATYKDADAALGDVQLPVMRSYDSLDKTSGDFGYGWSMSLDGMRVATNRVLGADGWQQYDANCRFGICETAYRTTVPHFVAVTFPDGHVETFDLTPRDTGSRSFARVAYTARKGTTSRLDPVEPEDVVYQGDGDLRDMDDLEPYAPTQFRLTTRTGQKLLLDVDEGLLSLTDPDGTTYAVTDTGITSTAGGGATWTRDAQGRITSLNADGTTSYEYDAAGDLVKVTDPLGREVTYTYDREHRMLTANGPGGTPLRTMNYDASGRLVSVTDADGNTTAVSSDPGARTQTITDPTGTLTTLLELDALGGVTRKTEVSGGTSRTWTYTYDQDGRQTSETDPLGSTTSTTYNAAGDVLSRVDAAGGTTSFTYGASGQLLSKTEPGDRTTTYTYDGGMRLTSVTDAAGTTQTFTYDSAGRTTAATDERGGTTAYAYDGAGRVTKRTDALGRSTGYGYDTAGRLETSTDPAGAVTRFERDDAGQLLARTDATGAVTRFTYDELGRTASRTGPTGGVTRYTHTPGGALASTTDPVGGTSGYEYDAAGRLVAETAPDGGRTTYAYDGFSRLLSQTAPGGGTTSYAYDSAGRLTTQTGPTGGSTSYVYDAAGRIVETTDAAGGTTAREYDAAGNLLAVTDPREGVTRYEYDVLGRVTAMTDPTGGVSRTEYDAAGSIAATVDPAGGRSENSYDVAGQLTARTDATDRTSRYEYDELGRTTQTVDPAGRATVTTYDPAGRPASRTTPSGATTAYRYDAAGLPVETVDPLGGVTSREYDAAGRLVAETDPAGRTMRFTLDAAGRTTVLTDALGGAVRNSYDAAGNMVKVVDPVGVETSYEYDASGRRTAEVDELGNRLEWGYDAAGRVTSSTNGRGQQTTSEYDAAGQLVRQVAPEGELRQAFDAAGRRTALLDPSGTTSFRYDRVGRLLGVSSTAGEVGYGYDRAGRRASLTAGGRTAEYDYDAAGLLETVTVGSAVTRYTNDEDGQVSTISHPNGVMSAYAYDAAGRLTGLQHEKSGTELAAFAYTLDAAGNRTAVDGPSGKESYTLDAAGRLTDVVDGSGAETVYGYDAAGNRTSVTRGASTTAYEYDAAGRLVGVGTDAVTRDPDGNVTGEGGRAFRYDSANRLVELTAEDVATHFGYDGDGRRVSTRTGSEPTIGSTYDTSGEHPVLLARGDTALLRDPYGRLLGEGESTPLVDGLGTVRALTSGTGSVTGTADYDVYGVERGTSGSASVLGFAGAPTDPAALVDLNARQYAPELGQFLQRDTVRPAGDGTVGWNTYTYAGNNPSTYVDPSGHMFTSVDASGTMAVQGSLLGISSPSMAQFAALIARARLVAYAAPTASTAAATAVCLKVECLPTRSAEPDRGRDPEPDAPRQPRPIPVPPDTDDDDDERSLPILFGQARIGPRFGRGKELTATADDINSGLLLEIPVFMHAGMVVAEGNRRLAAWSLSSPASPVYPPVLWTAPEPKVLNRLAETSCLGGALPSLQIAVTPRMGDCTVMMTISSTARVRM